MSQPEPAGDARQLTSDLSAVGRWLAVGQLLRTTAVVVPLCAVLYLVLLRTIFAPLVSAALAIACGGVASAIWMSARRSRWSPRASAEAIERARPTSRNVVVTAEELLRHPDRAQPWMATRVLGQAARIAHDAPVNEVVPLGRTSLIAAMAVVVSVILIKGLPQRATAIIRQAIHQAPGGASPAGQGRLSITATIAPPEYTGERPRTLKNPDRLEALQGSRLRLDVTGGGAWRVRFGATVLPTQAASGGVVTELPLQQSGYLAIEPAVTTSGASPRLLPVVVTPDRAPTIRVEAPGKDMLLPDTKRVVGLTASATDDYGLQSLELRYTKVSGSGEQFEFKEGGIPLTIATTSARAWNARADLALPALGLAPGDTLIYRIVGRDRRPGDAGLASSDTFFIEIAGPGQVALAGFELPPDRERYALSQQMIVLKLERLQARERTLDRAALEQEVGNIAAEQRAVRANFVFLMGGHVEDEEEEAAHSNEIQEGRLENTARREIMTAIQFMGKAEAGMAAISTSAALPPARAAVQALQRAFGKNRYFLRTLAVRSRIDPSRRLTGDTKEASDWTRERVPPPPEVVAQAARDILQRLLDLSPAIQSGTADPKALTTLAEEALVVDPGTDEWQRIASGVLSMREKLQASAAERTALLNQTLTTVSAVARREALTPRPLDGANHALRSAWAEEHRR